MKNFLGFAEKWFSILALLLSTGGPITVIRFPDADEGAQEGSDALLQALFFAIYIISLILLALRWKKVAHELIRKDKLIWLLLFFVVLSTFWSTDPATSLRRCVALVGTTLFAVYLATRYSVKEQLQIVCGAFGVAVLMSMFFGIVLRKYGVMQGLHGGAWRGIYIHKNILGGRMALSSILFLILLLGSGRREKTTWAGFIISVILLLLSTSKSSLLTFLELLAFLIMCMSFRWRYELLALFLLAIPAVSLGVGSLLVQNVDKLLGLLGKDATLTGRTDIWPYAWEMIQKRPWLGYGYSGFWGDWNSPGAYIWRIVNWQPPHSHNGFLDLLLVIGWVGMSIYALGFLLSFLRSLALIRLTKNAEYLWPLIFLLYTILSNLTESAILTYNSIHWVLYVMAVFSVIEQGDQVIPGTTKKIHKYFE